MLQKHLYFTSLLFLYSPLSAFAETFTLDQSDQTTVVGEFRSIKSTEEDTLVDLARRFDIGHDALIKANKETNRWVPGAGTEVLIPSMYVLPNAPKEGLVLNLAELRLYYFPPAQSAGAGRTVMVFPVSVGRMDWKTPLGKASIVRKQENPAWHPTKSVREEHAAEGDELPAMIAGGSEENPLGHYALYLNIPGYLIHGTDEKKSLGIGMRVTHGCVRMYPEDIQTLYSLVKIGTPVYLVNQPVKVGWRNADLYIEVHRPLDDDEQEQDIVPEQAMATVNESVKDKAQVNLVQIKGAIDRGDGLPVKIGGEMTAGNPAPGINDEGDSARGALTTPETYWNGPRTGNDVVRENPREVSPYGEVVNPPSVLPNREGSSRQTIPGELIRPEMVTGPGEEEREEENGAEESPLPPPRQSSDLLKH